MGISRRYKTKREYPTKQTGSVAKLMGLSDEGVRVYEQSGLIYPEKKNGKFRTFDIMDMVMLLYARVYRKCGFSMKEVKRLANDCELSDVFKAYEESIVRLKENIEWEQKRLQRVEELLGEIEMARMEESQYRLDIMPGMYRIEFLRKQKLDISLDGQEIIEKWMREYVPFAMLSTRYAKEELFVSREKREAISGLGIGEEYASFLGVEESKYIKYYSPHKAVHTILHADNEELNPDLSGCLNYIDSQNWEISGDAISFGIANLHFGEKFDRYFHIWIPVEEKRHKIDFTMG